jgi:hypothetical protein
LEAFLGLLPLALTILLIWAAVHFARRRQGPEIAGPYGERPYGVRGWLAFFVYCTMGLAPILGISRTNQYFINVERKYPTLLSFDGWSSYKVATWVAVAAVCAWQLFVALQMRNHFVPRSVMHARALLVGAPLVYWIADTAAAKLFLNADVTVESFGALIASWLIGAVWLGYLYKSQRVRNTYRLGDRGGSASMALTSNAAEDAMPASLRQPIRDTSAESRLKELQKLLEGGLISESDYKAKKREILSTL